MPGRSLTFRVIYNLSYGLLHLVLIAFLLVTPGDLINQARDRNQYANIIVTILSCVVSVTAIFLVYVTRLVVSRSVLASIPKPYIPIEKGDVREDVRVMIADGLGESAAVAFRARPRVATVTAVTAPLSKDGEIDQKGKGQSEASERHPWQPKVSTGQDGDAAATRAESEDAVVTIQPHPAPWGEVEHPGWGSPTSPDLPNLQYSAVIAELPHLIEAKVLTLAPPAPGPDDDDPGYLDAETAGLLQRAETMGLREYLVHLADMGVLAGLPAGVTKDFISRYEYARYSTRPLSNARFRELMHLFAQILRGMGPPDPDMLHGHDSHDDDDDDAAFSDDSHSDGDVDDNAPMATNPSTPGGNTSAAVGAGSSDRLRRFSSSTASYASSTRRPAHPPRLRLTVRTPSANTWQYRTAPTSPRTPRAPWGRQAAAAVTGDGGAPSRSSSANSFAQTRRPYGASSTPSLPSQSDDGSVIRATREDSETP